jgi:hypothetical protein
MVIRRMDRDDTITEAISSASGSDERRINTWVTTGTALALTRLA